jgi:hypothetical protein
MWKKQLLHSYGRPSLGIICTPHCARCSAVTTLTSGVDAAQLWSQCTAGRSEEGTLHMVLNGKSHPHRTAESRPDRPAQISLNEIIRPSFPCGESQSILDRTAVMRVEHSGQVSRNNFASHYSGASSAARIRILVFITSI